MIIPARQYHVSQMLAVGLRAADLAEIAASTDKSVEEALRSSLEASSKSWVGLDPSELPYCIFGVAPHTSPTIGIPWLIATGAQRHNLREFLKNTSRIVHEMSRGFRMLANYSDARHTESHRWLRWAGFKFDAAVPYGPECRAFYPFYRETKPCA